LFTLKTIFFISISRVIFIKLFLTYFHIKNYIIEYYLLIISFKRDLIFFRKIFVRNKIIIFFTTQIIIQRRIWWLWKIFSFFSWIR